MNSDAIEAAQRGLDAEIARAEAVVREHSLSGVRDGDDRADRASRQLVELHARRAVIAAALEQARVAERADLETRDRREREARGRSFRAHLSRVERHGRDAAEALAALVLAWQKMSTAAASARALLPGTAALAHEFAGLTDARLGALVAQELARIGQRHTSVGAEPVMSLVPRLLPGQPPENVVPLADALADQVRWSSQGFRRLLGLDEDIAP
jgi:hypothetical protein